MKNAFRLSALSAALLVMSVPVNAGQIVGVQQALPSPQWVDPADDVKNGFGGWNINPATNGNVNVKIIDAETGLEVAKTFDPTDGSYDAMVVGEGFVSEVTDGAGVVTGTVHGKTWPVGEPSGIKVITATLGDTLSNSKPASCIMSTSYHQFSDDPAYAGPTPEDGFLDSANPNPTMCDSPFQTHKRYKVKAKNTALDSVGSGVDVVFNVDNTTGETDVRRYMMLQKLNNYTDTRLDGYKIQLGFGVGAGFKPVDEVDADIITGGGAAADTVNGDVTKNLTLSIGTGEDAGGDVWAADDLAKFSAGLFGTADNKHPEDGFFSTSTSYYPVAVDASETMISTTGPLATNYTDLFGKWLPGGWETSGIFFDDDMDPATDNQLKAFWGLDATDSTYKWLQGQAASFAPVTDAQMYEWANNAGMPDGSNQYTIGAIDDMLNLGLTYIVEVGDVTNFPTQQFTVRMTPVDADPVDATEPGWITNPAPTELVAPAGYVPPVTPTDTDTSSGGSASVFDSTSLIISLLVLLGLGGWVARKKLAK